jgi:hypothetical protein
MNDDLDRDTLRSKKEIESPTPSKRIAIINARNERLKLWGSILGIIAAIVTSSIAYFKPEEDEGARDVYKELSTAVSDISKNQVELHKDVAAIQGYLRGRYAAEKRAVEEIKRDAEEDEPPRARIAARRPTVGGGIGFGIGVGTAPKPAPKPTPTVVVIPDDLQEAAPPPPQAQKPAPYKPPPVDSVVKK